MTTIQNTVATMHQTFCLHSGLECRATAHERTWYELAKAGYVGEDIDIYCRWVLHENSQNDPQYRKRFHIPKMFGDLSEFDADLALAKQWANPPPQTKEERDREIIREAIR